MKRLPWKYLAGLIDGEGCIDVQVTRQVYVRPRFRMALTASCRDLLVWASNSYGGHLCDRPGKGNHQPSTSWECAGYASCNAVLRNVVNHLILKREQALFCLWLEREIKGRHVSTEVRDAIREELKLMKRDPHRLSEKAQERILGML